jgi:hypothetical protein
MMARSSSGFMFYLQLTVAAIDFDAAKVSRMASNRTACEFYHDRLDLGLFTLIDQHTNPTTT